MSAATFIMAINLCVAGIFATAFGVVAAYARSSVGARWLAGAYGIGMLNPVLELILPLQTDARLVGIAIFTNFLVALACCVIGLARHYRLEPPWRLLGLVIVAAVAVNSVTIDMPRDSMLRALLYQLPYFLVQTIGVATILRVQRRQPLDSVLLVVLAFSGLQFLSKPLLAAAIGSGGSAQGYIGSSYAAISQTSGAVLLIANGLLMLLIIVRDAMAEMTARSETDKLSALLNRRGFEDRAERLLATVLRTGVPAAMVVADLDHFKAINDSHGHEAGDRVIAAFAQIMRAVAGDNTLLCRLGGEEFAALIPGTNAAGARLYAEGVRAGFSGVAIVNAGPGRHLSASFGVAQLLPGDTMSDLLRRADAALYQAKKSGRDRVCLAEPALQDERRQA